MHNVRMFEAKLFSSLGIIVKNNRKGGKCLSLFGQNNFKRLTFQRDSLLYLV